MKKHLKTTVRAWMLLLSAALLIVPGPLFSQSQHPLSKTMDNPLSDNYLQGAIVLKVKKGIELTVPQRLSVNFGIQELDELAEHYSAVALSKRFRNKPIPRNSGLPDLSRIYKLEFPPETNVLEVASAFGADPRIEYAEPILLGKFTEIPDDPMYPSQQHLPQIMAPEAWDVHHGEDGEEVVVAIVDTGTDWLHPDLTENTWQNLGEDADNDGVTLEFNNGTWERDPDDLNGIDDDGNGYVDDVIGWDFHEEFLYGDGSNPDPMWNQGPFEHGTHCAGITAGVTDNGIGISSVSWNIRHMAVQTDAGNNTVVYGIDGIIYAAEQGADIISNSWYYGYGYSQADFEAMQYALGLGSIICFAAANDNNPEPAYPAGYPGIISVAAVNPDDTRASFSNYGIGVDIAAPGVSILSTIPNNGYASWGGTSMATPMVAGLLGFVKSYQPEWTNEELINQVIGTADDIDALNPGYENALGDGRINAYHALIDENVVPQQELKLELLNYTVDDENGNGIIEPGESASVGLAMRNWSHLVGSEDVTMAFYTYDPDITITSGAVSISIPADDEFVIEDALEFTVNEEAPTKEATFIIHFDTDMEVTFGQDLHLNVLLAPSGFFVWDGIKNHSGHSGALVSQFLDEQGYPFIYSDAFPRSLIGFDAVFLSFGNGGQNADQAVMYDYNHSLVVQEYLESGGALYIEGMAIMSMPGLFGWDNIMELRELFGITTSSIGQNSNPINSLEGQDGSLAEDMLFTESNQLLNWYIDKVIPAAGAVVPFYESDYGNVSVYNEGAYGQRTFYLGYCLADLEDDDPHSSRYHLLAKIMDMFGYGLGDDYVVANFTSDAMETVPGESVHFSDWSVTAPGTAVESWAWDFNEDGLIDSNEEDPTWTFQESGLFDVMLAVSNGASSDTLVRKNTVMVKSGVFVYEGQENGIDQSGAFIRDYLQDNGYEVVYANTFPDDLAAFDAVFATFGSAAYTSPEMSDDMANRIKNYGLQGGRIYLEGANALGRDQSGNNLLWFIFGLEDVQNGSTNMMDGLGGMEGSIMEGLEFAATDQLNQNSIDIYDIYPTATLAAVAFEESDYGPVAIQFEGTQFYGQKTFCMSYSLAQLQDGDYPSTRHEVISRILAFFDVTTNVHPPAQAHDPGALVYPNPASDQVTFSFNLMERAFITTELFDLAGKKMMAADQHFQTAGKKDLHLSTRGLPPGAYLYRLLLPHRVISGKLLIER